MPEPTRLVWRSDLGWSAYSPADHADPTSGLVIHYDSQDQGLAEQDHSACVDYWRWCRDFHTGSRGWADVGYSWMACPHGYVMEGRGLHRYQAAQGTTSGNRDYYSVTLACGPTDPITDAQVDAVRELRQWLMEPSTSISGDVLGHRDFKSTSCPGDTAYAMVQSGVFERDSGASVPDGSGGDSGSGGGDSEAPDWPGVYLSQPPVRHTQACETWQARMRDRGWMNSAGRALAVDGWYGPESERVCRFFQDEKGLALDGIVGPETWGAAWTEPVT